MRLIAVLAAILLSSIFVLPPAANAQTVNGDGDTALAIGKWKESHEGVTVFCGRITTRKDVVKGNSNGACFLTEAQLTANGYGWDKWLKVRENIQLAEEKK